MPDPRAHGLYGYAEVIDTIEWGLRELGCDVTRSFAIASDRPNILFGGQMLQASVAQNLGSEAIYVNMEQIFGLEIANMGPAYKIFAEKSTIWEYCPLNFEKWRQLGAQKVESLPICYYPGLTRLSDTEQDIDVLFYGIPAPQRIRALVDVCARGLKCIYACGLYGEARDGLIARSKIVLNVNAYEASRLFEIVRVSYLLANHKAVVADIHPNSQVETDMQSAVAFAPLEQIAALCDHLIRNDDERVALQEKGFAAISKRDIREALKPLLERYS